MMGFLCIVRKESLPAPDWTYLEPSWLIGCEIDFYKQPYRIESQAKDLGPQQRLVLRQQKAVPIWSAFIDWTQKVIDDGIGHAPSRQALS